MRIRKAGVESELVAVIGGPARILLSLGCFPGSMKLQRFGWIEVEAIGSKRRGLAYEP